MNYPRIARLKTADQFLSRVSELGLPLPFDHEIQTGPGAPLARPYDCGFQSVGNRFAILPMEGWDGTTDGRPTELTIRRWQRFGISGSKLIWGGEAVAVRPDGRANPNQLMINDQTLADIEQLRLELVGAHQKEFGKTDDLLIGLQLTHSGRFARPYEKAKLESRILYHHPILDRRSPNLNDQSILTDDEIDRLVDDFLIAGRFAHKAGYTFVDLKHCHGYLGHEFLSGFDRPGKYGGSLENRTRFLRSIVEGLKADVPELKIGVRVSLMDWFPFHPGADRVGEPDLAGGTVDGSHYHFAFGGDGTGLGHDLTETFQLLDLLQEMGIPMICSTVGSPYYNPHIQRPASFPPSDGYLPPEDPLCGVSRQIAVTAECKRHAPNMLFVGSGYSYLQEWLPNVGQSAVAQGMVDFVGLGRMALIYPDMAADVLAGRPLVRKKMCRTFSDCTTAPRNGLVSGCYPLDEYYKSRPEYLQLHEIKQKSGV